MCLFGSILVINTFLFIYAKSISFSMVVINLFSIVIYIILWKLED